ncbi:hydantoinase B/oxoprolinase family protein [Thermaurantiacus sp.]
MSEALLEIAIDRGGTFTDAIARRPDGTLLRHKRLSHDPAAPEDAVVASIRALARRHRGPLLVKLGTTVATNALLERTGEPTLLVVTRGFGDALLIGHQARPDIFALHIRRPPPLAAETIEVDERVAADGTVLRPLDRAGARRALAEARARGLKAVAICLLHAHRFPDHEIALAALAREVGFEQVSASHRVSPLEKFVPRAETTVVDAYLSPVLGRYLATVGAGLPGGARLLVMQSNGGLADARAISGKDAVLSGPAGGVVGMVEAGRAAGFDRLIGFDMGGTSTDVSHWAGRFERRFETEVAGARLRAPLLDIVTVAAGGGSICRFAQGRLQVGPGSAGAVPGPACYRLGGPATITDCNLVLGRIRPEAFPRVFGPSGSDPPDLAASHAALARLAADVEAETGERPIVEALAESLVAIANAHMADAIRQVSIARGHDPATHALVAFGGAGGQHATALADALGIGAVVIPPDAGLLSARGIAAAPLSVHRQRTLGLALDAALEAALAEPVAALVAEAEAALRAQAVPLRDIRVRLSAHVRYANADTALAVPLGPAGEMARAFEAAHRARFGFLTPGAGLVLDLVEAEATGDPPTAAAAGPPAGRMGPPPDTWVEALFGGRLQPTRLLERAQLGPGATVEGPAIITDPDATTVVEPGWRAERVASGALVLRRTGHAARAAVARPTAARLELLHALFTGIANEMGLALQLSARSVNIKERLDFSCAIFDRDGALVTNAPHIPVHLGSMGESVRAVIAARASDGRGLRPGDVYALNAPWAGGTHLPDITVIRAVFPPGGSEPVAFVAARGHHADIGGLTPGSMPPASRTIAEEGVVLDNVLLVDGGQFEEAGIRALLSGARFPARNPEQNVADLKAQVAAVTRGAEALLAADVGPGGLKAAMAALADNAEAAVRRAIGRLRDGAAEVPMDNGAVIRVAVRVDRARRHLLVDFRGTSPERPDNFNAPPAVARAALLYVLRCLVAEPIPLNDGCLRAVDLRIPPGSMLCPGRQAAVVAGNVETSQAITDALLAAFGAMAASAGSMSNLTFGNGCHQYYETIAGGSGAGPGFDGAAAVQTHMTNSRLTDPEVLEARLPVRVEVHALRRGSGGRGRFRGGDGAIRRLRFTAPVTVSILSNRRRTAPFGLAGGAAGAPGCNRLLRASGAIEDLGPTATRELGAGDAIEIATPGGGGFGS